jgi:hypothetical protein
VGACIRSSWTNGRGAGRLGVDRYGLFHGANLDVAALERHIGNMTRKSDPEAIGTSVQATTIAIDRTAGSETAIAGGLIYAINRFRSFAGCEFTLRHLSTNLPALAREAIEVLNGFKHVVANS